MSASTGAPSALARSEGSMEAAKGTAVATAAALPAQALAMTSVRRPRLIPASSFMGEILAEGHCRGGANYTESALPGQIFDAKLLILYSNSGTHPRNAGTANGFAQ